MATSIVIPTRPDVGAFSDTVATAMVTERGNYDARVANELVDVATAAAADITALQAGTSIAGVNGTTIAVGGALTIGQVLRATAADAAAWGQVNLAAAAAVTGVLPGANVAAAVAGVSQGAISAADQTHLNITPTMQIASATLASGTATVNTVITLTSSSRIFAKPTGAITGSTNYAECRELFASRVNGAASTASTTIEALTNTGVLDSDAAGAIHITILTPHA